MAGSLWPAAGTAGWTRLRVSQHDRDAGLPVGRCSRHTLVAVTGGPRDAAAGAIGSHTDGGTEEVEGLPEEEERWCQSCPDWVLSFSA